MWDDSKDFVTFADISKPDKNKADAIVAYFDQAFISGSYLLHPDKAADIDVVVPVHEWLESSVVSLHGFIKTEVDDTDNEYAEDTSEGALYATYRGPGLVNIIVVHTEYWGCYVAGRNRMLADPKKYADKEVRVEMHKAMKRTMKEWLSASMEDVAVPY